MRGKGGREDRLPLPADVGEAIAGYLRRGRPASDRREVFLRARAPFAPIAPGTVSSTVRRACRRAGIAEVGSHRLRHTMACEMVAAQRPAGADRAGAAPPQPAEHRDLRARGSRPAAAARRAVAGERRAMSALQRTRRGLPAAAPRAGVQARARTGRSCRSWSPTWRPPARSTITRELAIAWARLAGRRAPATTGRRGWRSRAGLPPTCRRSTRRPRSRRPECSPSATSRPTPYLWSQQRHRPAARRRRATLRPPLRAASYEALFGLLAVSGMRARRGGRARAATTSTSTPA